MPKKRATRLPTPPVKCSTCGKEVAARGLNSHMRLAHGTSAATSIPLSEKPRVRARKRVSGGGAMSEGETTIALIGIALYVLYRLAENKVALKQVNEQARRNSLYQIK